MPGPSRDPVKAAAHLAALVDSSEDAIISKSLGGIVESWNKSAERIFGYTEEEAIGRNIGLIIPPDLHDEETRILDRLRQGQRIEPFETVRRRKDGTLVDISLAISPIRDDKGQIIGASKIARDITAQKRAQRALIEAQNRMAVTLGSIGDAVVATDTRGHVTFVNPVAESLLGCTQSDIMARPLQEVFRILNENTRQPVTNPVDRVLAEGCIVGLANHTVLLHPDGREIPIDDSAAPIRDADGHLVGVVLVFRDVTAQHRSARIAALLSALVTSSDDAIISKDFKGTITSWNQGAERLFGYTPEEIVGQSVRVLIPPDRQHEEVEILGRLTRGERIDHYETVRRKKNGQLCDISLTVSPIRDTEGRLLGASKIARDITEQKRAQRALYESQERWRVTLESIGDAVMATDPKGLVTFANSVALQLLGRSQVDVIGRPLAESFSIIHESTRRRVVNPVERVIREGKVIGLANHTLLVRPDRSEIPIDDTAAPIQGKDGRLMGVVLVFRDISDRARNLRR
jgi:PAS domain S-box-containing protein